MNDITQIFNGKNILRILLIAGLAISLAGQTVIASEKKWIIHKDKWKDVMAYGTIPIDEDSPTEWGPWTQFVQPAAGPVAVLPSMPTDGTAYFRPESTDEYSPKYDLDLEEGFCKGGEWCGYTVYTNASSDHGVKSRSGPLPGRIGLTLTPDAKVPDEIVLSHSIYKVGGSASWRATGLFGADDPAFTESGDMTATFFNIPANFFAHTEDSYSETRYDKAYANGLNPWGYPDEITKGFFGRNAETEDPSIEQGVSGIYIAGIPTPLSDLSALRADSFTATYCGRAFQGSHVKIDVDFGPGTWSGEWNRGYDGRVWKSPNGTLYGRVGFTAKGNINGTDFYSTKVSANDDVGPNGILKVKGNVLGSFYGKDAKALAGVADITKTKIYGYDSVESKPTNIANGDGSGYQKGRYVDLFKAIQVPTEPTPR